MQSHQRWGFVAVGSLLVCAWSSSKVHAYCQTTTSKQQVSSCSPSCITDGFPLAWPKSNITYVFNEKGFPGLSDQAMRGIFADAFGAWESVDCEGEPVGLTLTAASDTTSLTVGPEKQEPNASVIAHLSAAEWSGLGLDANAFALTALWFHDKSGRILGADMHFNGGMAPFGVCPARGCQSGQQVTDLPNVATHEAGHFLGLAHSQDQESTMWCDARGDETNKRTLSPDDSTGLCATYPPDLAFTEGYFPVPGPTSRHGNDGCSIQTPRPWAWSVSWGALSLCAFALWRRRGKV